MPQPWGRSCANTQRIEKIRARSIRSLIALVKMAQEPWFAQEAGKLVLFISPLLVDNPTRAFVFA